jgi:hypothetical protein
MDKGPSTSAGDRTRRDDPAPALVV